MFLRKFGEFTKPLVGLVKRVVGVAGFEPATPSEFSEKAQNFARARLSENDCRIRTD